MIWLENNLERIQKLLDEDTAQSLTYAALECRLAIEQVCYQHLRNDHDYISHSDLKKWQPGAVVRQLVQEVNKHAATTATMYISAEPTTETNPEMTLEDFEKLEYLKIGTQIGFIPKQMEKLWNALGNFLHVKMPESKEDAVNVYSDPEKLRKKLNETIKELERLSKGTMIMGGVGETVTFQCICGAANKRRVELLKHGDCISCINPDCVESWNVVFEGNEISFVRQTLSVTCKECGEKTPFAARRIMSLGKDKICSFECECGETNYVRWALVQATQPLEKASQSRSERP